MKLVRITLICLLSVLGLALRSMAAPIHAQSTMVVTIQGFAFSPATLTIPAGTVVVWTNKDSVDHTATSDTGVWDVSDIASGQSSSGTPFNTPGTYPYHCAIHPDMHGTIVVLAAGSGPTATPVPTSVPTSAPVSTPGPTATDTVTAPPAPTATNTPTPLFVKLAIGHHTVKAGAKQSIKVTTLARAAISIVITFPAGARKHRSAIAPASGTFTWTYKQPGGHTTRTKHTAKVAVTVSLGSGSPAKASKSYVIS